MLDALHLHKIDMADRVLIVNPGGYVGDSTRREIAYAQAAGKPITFNRSPLTTSGTLIGTTGGIRARQGDLDIPASSMHS